MPSAGLSLFLFSSFAIVSIYKILVFKATTTLATYKYSPVQHISHYCESHLPDYYFNHGHRIYTAWPPDIYKFQSKTIIWDLIAHIMKILHFSFP